MPKFLQHEKQKPNSCNCSASTALKTTEVLIIMRKNKRKTQYQEITLADYMKCPDPIGTMPAAAQKRFAEEFRKLQRAKQVERHE